VTRFRDISEIENVTLIRYINYKIYSTKRKLLYMGRH